MGKVGGRGFTGGRLVRRTQAGLLGVLLAAGCIAAGAAAPPPLFESGETLQLTIEAPWSAVLASRNTKQAHAAVVGYVDASGQSHRIEATVETRGVTRLRECRFPPLRLRFARAATAGTVFERQRSLKLVTHCAAGAKYEQYYVQELLAYRIYHLVAEHAFRVRPLAVRYVDAKDGKAGEARFAFLIEDLRELTRRTGYREAREARFSAKDFDAQAMTRFALFQYLIGNTDWEVLAGPQDDECCHNVRVIGADDPHVRIAVPYDFDSAGMVDAAYAAPHERLPIRRVTQRLFRGFCRHNAALPAARRELLELRTAIFELVRNEPRLDASRRRVLERFLEGAYTVLDSDSLFAREVSAKCRR